MQCVCHIGCSNKAASGNMADTNFQKIFIKLQENLNRLNERIKKMYKTILAYFKDVLGMPMCCMHFG